MKLVDVHCHLESAHFENRLDRVLADARKVGIAAFITCSIDPAQWDITLGIASQHSDVFSALGIHPWYIRPEYRADLTQLVSRCADKTVAIGEIGIDKKNETTPFELQMEFFEAQMDIARQVGLPVIVHCRGAFNELILFMKRFGNLPAGGIIHSFSGSAEIARDLSRFGFSFSMGGILTYRNSARRTEALKSIYPDRFLLETDSPDIPPVHLRGEPNVPANIVHNLRAAAEILGRDISEVAERTSANAAAVFSLKL